MSARSPRYDWSSFDAHVLALALKLSCTDLIRHYGLAPRGRAPQFNIICPHPAHDDSEPSCSVRRDSWKCFGCHERGDVLDLIGVLDDLTDFTDKIRRSLELQGLDYDAEREAFLERARAGFPTHAPARAGTPPSPSPSPPGPPDAPAPTSRHPNDSAILSHVLGALTLSDEAGSYLERRGLLGALARAHGIVSASYDQWRVAIGAAGDRFGAEAIEQAGLVGRGGRAHPYVERMLLMPYMGPDGPVGIRIRRLSHDTTYQGARYLGRCHGHNAVPVPYLGRADGAPTGIVPHKGVLFVVEGEFDALSLRALGRASVGVPGAQTFQDRWVEGWADLERVVLLLDADRAGVHAARDLAEAITAAAVEVHGQAWAQARLHVRPTVGAKDPNELHARGELLALVRELEAGLGLGG